MLDLAFIREHPDLISEVARRRKTAVDVDALLATDTRAAHRQAPRRRPARGAEQGLTGDPRGRRRPGGARGRHRAGTRPRAELKEVEPRERDLETHLRDLWLLVPNIPDASRSPKGRARRITSRSSAWASRAYFDFEPLDHVALMKGQDWLDLERAAKVSGLAQLYPQGRRRLLEFALMQFALDRIARKGFTPLEVPVLAKEFCLLRQCQFPRGREQTYACPTTISSSSAPPRSRSPACTAARS